MQADPKRLRRFPYVVALVAMSLAAASAAFAIDPQFGGYCAEGLVKHMRVKTDCSITWTGKDGKLYCFSSKASKAMFLEAPDENIKKATENYAH